MAGKLNTEPSIAYAFVTTGGLTLFWLRESSCQRCEIGVTVRSAIQVAIAVLLLVGRPLAYVFALV